VGDGFFDERSRWSDLTELPLCYGEVGSRGRAVIRAKAEPGFTIPLGIVKALPTGPQDTHLKVRRWMAQRMAVFVTLNSRASRAIFSPAPCRRRASTTS
jgi:hypothetical protein